MILGRWCKYTPTQQSETKVVVKDRYNACPRGLLVMVRLLGLCFTMGNLVNA